MEIEIKDITGLGQPLTKLLEVVEKGVGKIYESVHLRKMAQAKADEIKLLEQAKTDAEVSRAKQLAVLPDEIIVQLPHVADEVVERAKLRLAQQEIRRQLNLDRIVTEAVTSLPEQVDSVEVDSGWIARFFSAAADVSDTEMQTMWGKLLAGETASPGRFNARALEVLKNLSKEEAELFAHACTFVTGANEYIIKVPTATKQFISSYDDKALAELGLKFEQILQLVDAGLMHPSTETTLDFGVGKSTVRLMNNGRFFTLALDPEVDSKKINLHVYTFTLAGRQLGTLVPNTFNEKYLALLAERFKTHGVILNLENHA
jgi:uncharacterized repeat protein (TIGR03899 family)